MNILLDFHDKRTITKETYNSLKGKIGTNLIRFTTVPQEGSKPALAVKDNLFSPKNIIELDSSTNTIKILPSVGLHLRNFMKDIISNSIVSVYTS